MIRAIGKFVRMVFGGGLCLSLALHSAGLGADDMSRGAAYLKPYKIQLKSALVAGMQQGPEYAISVCRSEAPMIASSVAPEGVEMGRSSHRLRNRGNAPRAWVAPLIEHYVQNPQASAPRMVQVSTGRRGYVEPIYMQAVCLTCHGTDIPPAVARRIADGYPDDQATGFGEGDFRGVFWVEFLQGEVSEKK